MTAELLLRRVGTATAIRPTQDPLMPVWRYCRSHGTVSSYPAAESDGEQIKTPQNRRLNKRTYQPSLAIREARHQMPTLFRQVLRVLDAILHGPLLTQDTVGPEDAFGEVVTDGFADFDRHWVSAETLLGLLSDAVCRDEGGAHCE